MQSPTGALCVMGSKPVSPIQVHPRSPQPAQPALQSVARSPRACRKRRLEISSDAEERRATRATRCSDQVHASDRKGGSMSTGGGRGPPLGNTGNAGDNGNTGNTSNNGSSCHRKTLSQQARPFLQCNLTRQQQLILLPENACTHAAGLAGGAPSGVAESAPSGVPGGSTTEPPVSRRQRWQLSSGTGRFAR